MINYGKQYIDEDDVAAVVECLQSDFLTQGPKVKEFEHALSVYTDSTYSVVTNSATSALHLACLVLGVKEGDSVWTSPISFVASANCALYCGAKVDFVDIEINTGLMSVKSLEDKLIVASVSNTLPTVIIPVHFAGQSCDMKAIKKMADKYNIQIIEDASHALGASYKGNKVGCCEFSDICIFSFHPVKMITTGEGGALLTNNEIIYNKAVKLRSHGISKSPEIDPWYYRQVDLGYNYRMPDILASLGISQLKKIDRFVNDRKCLANIYLKEICNKKAKSLKQNRNSSSSYHLYPVLFNNKESRKIAYEKLKAKGIMTQVHYIPIYQQPYYKSIGAVSLDNSEKFYERVLSLPIYVGLTESQVVSIANEINCMEI